MSAVVVKLPRAAERGIDVRDLLLNNQSAPELSAPRKLQAAIDAKARALAEEAYELCREHLRRRAAYHSEYGYPQRKIHMDKALRVVAEGDLGDALVRVYRQKMMMVVESAKTASHISERFAEVADEVFGAIEGQRPA